jgi:hypothetical protein
VFPVESHNAGIRGEESETTIIYWQVCFLRTRSFALVALVLFMSRSQFLKSSVGIDSAAILQRLKALINLPADYVTLIEESKRFIDNLTCGIIMTGLKFASNDFLDFGAQMDIHTRRISSCRSDGQARADSWGGQAQLRRARPF